jgi:hypothetical protein
LASRVCPHCGTEISAIAAAAKSNSIECPKCGARLEVGDGARTISSSAGFAVGAVVYWMTTSPGGRLLPAVLPTVYAFIAFGVVSALVVMATATLRNAPALPVALPSHDDAHGHGAPAHGSDHH